MVPRTPKVWLALGAVIGPIIGTLGWLVLGVLRPGYSLVSQPVSALGIGPNGIYMNAAFVVDGLMCLVAVVAIFQNLLGLSPFGILWDGIFTMNQLALHTLGTQLAITSCIVSFLIAGLVLRRVPTWRRFGTWMIFGSPLTLGLLIGFLGSVPRADIVSGLGGGTFGLWERALAPRGSILVCADGHKGSGRASRLKRIRTLVTEAPTEL